MMDNINTNTMVGKVVAVCIALLFIVVLAFPIANSLSNMGGNDGGSGEDEPQKTVINSWDESVGLTSTKYKSYEMYLSSETPTLPHEISYTLEDIMEMADTFTPVGNSGDFNLTFINAFNTEQAVSMYVEGNDIRVHVPSKIVDIGAVESFTVNIATDYTVSYSLKTSDSDDVLTGQITADEVLVLSESEYGWINKDLSADQPYITKGSGLYVDADYLDKYAVKTVVLTQDMFSDNQVQFTVDWGEGYYSDVTIPIQSTDTEGVWQIAWDGDNYVPITVKDSSGTEVENSDVFIDGITTYGYVSSDSSEITVTNSGQTYALTDENTNKIMSIKEDNGHWQVYLGTWANQYDQMVYECANNPDAIPMVLLCGGTDIDGSHTSNGYWLLSNGTILHNGTLPSNSVIEISGKYAEIHNSGGGYCDYYISSDGNYVYSTDSKILNDSTIYINTIWFDESADEYISFGSKGTILNISENITITTPTTSGDTATNVSIDKTDKGGYTILNSITVTATDPSDSSITYSGTADGFIVPKTFTYESSDSDSDSGSGIGGVASTLIKLVPILLIVSLLLVFIVPMVYKPN